MYCNLLEQSAVADRFGAISTSQHCAVEQIKKANLGLRSHYKVLDLGVGSGFFLEQLKPHMPQAEFTGIDISSEMLRNACERMPLVAIEGSATEANRFLPHHSQDLVLAHFINAYIPFHTLFNQAQLLTRSNGHFSLVTTTYDSFPIAQQYLADFVAQDSLLSSIVGHYYKAIVKNTTIASGQTALLEAFHTHDFEIVEHQRLSIPMQINTLDELALFSIEGTWFLNSIAIRMLPKKFLLQRLKRLFSKIFTFPYEDTHLIDVVLAKK